MVESDNLRYTKIALNNGSGAIPTLGFGTLIPDPMATKTATKAALEAGFRLLDASERYRNETEVGAAMQEVIKAGKIKQKEWHRVASCLFAPRHRRREPSVRFAGRTGGHFGSARVNDVTPRDPPL